MLSKREGVDLIAVAVSDSKKDIVVLREAGMKQ
jgi:hypothetical protein